MRTKKLKRPSNVIMNIPRRTRSASCSRSLIACVSLPTTMTITIVIANKIERKGQKMDENAKVAPISMNTPCTAMND
jgi:hypothetical protein